MACYDSPKLIDQTEENEMKHDYKLISKNAYKPEPFGDVPSAGSCIVAALMGFGGVVVVAYVILKGIGAV